MKRTIEVIVSPAGEIIIDAFGFEGADCERATRYLEEALGVAGPRQKKPEYHQRAKSNSQQRIGS
jgi:hypothetical protein